MLDEDEHKLVMSKHGTKEEESKDEIRKPAKAALGHTN